LKTVLFKAGLRDDEPHDSYSSSDEGVRAGTNVSNGVAVQASDGSGRNGSTGSIIHAGNNQGASAQDYFADPARYE
jgi:hypothetical protein